MACEAEGQSICAHRCAIGAHYAGLRFSAARRFAGKLPQAVRRKRAQAKSCATCSRAVAALP
jgi:hypothetical protein